MSGARTSARTVGKRSGSRRPVWLEAPGPFVQGVRAVVLVLAVGAVLVPFWSIVATSLADRATMTDSGGGMVLWPSGWTLEAYRAVLSGGVVTRALLISVLVTGIGTLASLAATAGLAFWLSRPRAAGAGPMLLLVLGAVLFSPGLIPTYLVVKEFGLLDSYGALVLPVLINAFNVLVMRAFFQELPEDLFESAALDGASSLTVLVRIVLPLSRAVLAVIGLFYAVGYWNAFFNALLYLQSTEKWPMALVLRTFVVNQTSISSEQVGLGEALPPQLPMQMAILVVAVVPILLVYPFLQRHFAKGVLVGAVKG